MKYFGRPSGPDFNNLTFLDYFDYYTVQPTKRISKRQYTRSDHLDDSGCDSSASLGDANEVNHGNNAIDTYLYNN